MAMNMPNTFSRAGRERAGFSADAMSPNLDAVDFEGRGSLRQARRDPEFSAGFAIT